MTAPADCRICCPAGWSPNIDQVPDENCPEHGREHLCYADEHGEPEECVEDCPGCHYEGNVGCDSWPDCALCNPDG